ncbi:phenylalanine--tRNA ligase subunit alpha [candidate division WS5 bacterium]|uniref:Phenylalanine--tRNA ligase alpha subunit n=1 Tax=candidate division WS5 bacterium TaxID=2093353 RepID=A0A419DCY0_9BACT|nr:MAG: phenylalanine--tRNA ligase subunit alpha [candidate division WS5 bacterium]
MDTKEIKQQLEEDIQKAESKNDLVSLKIKYLGKKSEIYKALRSLGSLSVEERKSYGAELNSLRVEIQSALKAREDDLSGGTKEVTVDFTEPGIRFDLGHMHPISQVYEELYDIAKTLGFSIADGPDIETDWYNFEALNFPKGHPARDTQDSFYFDENKLLRTHTSNVQIRYMENHKPPIRVVASGRTYRRDSDVTHTPMFHQLEGLLVDDRVTFADLKGVLTAFAQGVFGRDRKVRFRPHHFPFTEPSVEVDVSCGICGGKGCRSCKYSGWLEILGAGMVHPSVLKNCGIDPTKYQGFAFGMGVDRITMLKYGIDDTRLFFENDLRFLEQF